MQHAQAYVRNVWMNFGTARLQNQQGFGILGNGQVQKPG
jgi:hypothetical protein